MKARSLLTLLAGVLATLWGHDLLAQNGGGGGDPVAGTVYFRWSVVRGAEELTWQMDADGTNKSALPAAGLGEPSQTLHTEAGRDYRWFLNKSGGEIVAIREDGGHEIQLTYPTDGVAVGSRNSFHWGKDDPGTAQQEADTFVSYAGTDPTGSRAIFRLSIDWTAGTPSRQGSPQAVVSGGDLDGNELEGSHDWAPVGDGVAYQLEAAGGGSLIYVKDLVSGERYLLADGIFPFWSPDGAKIAFQVGLDIATINPDRSGLQVVVRGHGGQAVFVALPTWSPTGTHFVYLRSPLNIFSTKESDLYRVTASGGSKSNLTTDIDAGPFNEPVPVGWRSKMSVGPPPPGITVNPIAGLLTTEAGGTDTFTVVLDTQPTADVTIGISSNDTSEGTVFPSSLTFTAADWDTSQIVTVTGVDDLDADGDVTYTILTAAAVSTGSDYGGLDSADVSVTNIDDDGPISVTVDSIIPTQITAGAPAEPFSIVGSGFQPGASVSFENGSGPAPQLTEIMVVSDTQIAGMISVARNGPKVRVWDVRVTNPDSSTDVLPAALTVVK